MSEPPVEHRDGARRPRFRSFRSKLLLIVALAVSVPALLACLILGYQLDRQARTLFASELAANLETFSLILQDAQENLYRGLVRTATDNTLQVTLDLDIKPQLARYIEAQRQVLSIAFLGVYDRESASTAFSGSEEDSQQSRWRMAAAGEAGAADCVASRHVDQQIVRCGSIYYLVAVVPVVRLQDANLGDASARTQRAGLLGYLVGGIPLTHPQLIASLQARRIAHPLMWVGDELIYSNISASALRPPGQVDGSAQEFKLGKTAFLVAARPAPANSPLTYGVATPLAPLESALLGSVMTVAALGLLLVAGTLLAGAFMTNRLLLPIRQLREGAAQIGSGDLNKRISIDTGDEVQALADQFNEMARRLQESYADLEKKVELRTHELSRSLEQQTATSEILRIIAASPTDVTPVLHSVTTRAAELCEASDARLFLLDGEELKYVAGFGEFEDVSQTLPLSRGVVTGRAIIDRCVVHIEDLAAHLDEFPQARGPQQQFGHRTTLAVPLLRESRAFGAILMRRNEVRPFSDNQIELVKTFADQATIAIENVRLFNEIQDKSRQLEVANRHKSEFLASMSHELRTPLNAVIGYSEVLQERMFGDVNEKQAHYLKVIHNSGTHLLSLINDILDLSKIEAGRMDLELSRFNLRDALENSLTLVRERTTRNNVALELDCNGVGEWVADERKFKQIMLNLLSNAVKFTPQGGRISVRAWLADSSVHIAVSDTGVGIRSEDQQLVFEQFRQVGADHLKKSEGTGLGLALTKRFVELHGGGISLESAAGKGATFTFTLPEHQLESA